MECWLTISLGKSQVLSVTIRIGNSHLPHRNVLYNVRHCAHVKRYASDGINIHSGILGALFAIDALRASVYALVPNLQFGNTALEDLASRNTESWSARDELPNLHRDSLARKLSIKPDSHFYDWLERELAHRLALSAFRCRLQGKRTPWSMPGRFTRSSP